MEIQPEYMGAAGIIAGYLLKKWFKDINSVAGLVRKQSELVGQVKALREDAQQIPKLQMKLDAAWKQIDKNEANIEKLRFKP